MEEVIPFGPNEVSRAHPNGMSCNRRAESNEGIGHSNPVVNWASSSQCRCGPGGLPCADVPGGVFRDEAAFLASR